MLLPQAVSRAPAACGEGLRPSRSTPGHPGPRGPLLHKHATRPRRWGKNKDSYLSFISTWDSLLVYLSNSAEEQKSRNNPKQLSWFTAVAHQLHSLFCSLPSGSPHTQDYTIPSKEGLSQGHISPVLTQSPDEAHLGQRLSS